MDPRFLRLALKQKRNYNQRLKHVKVVDIVPTWDLIEQEKEELLAKQEGTSMLTKEQEQEIEKKYLTDDIIKKHDEAKLASRNAFSNAGLFRKDNNGTVGIKELQF